MQGRSNTKTHQHLVDEMSGVICSAPLCLRRWRCRYFHRPRRRLARPSPGPLRRPRRGLRRGRGGAATARYRAWTPRGLRPPEAVPLAKASPVHGAPTSAQWRQRQCVHVHYDKTERGEWPGQGGCGEYEQVRCVKTVRGALSGLARLMPLAHPLQLKGGGRYTIREQTGD